MAADRAAASGIDAGEGLRQRAAGPSQVSPAAPQPIDDKKLAKKVGLSKARPLIPISNNIQAPTVLDTFNQWEPIFAPLIFTALAFFTRLWKIGISDIVTWDEAQ